MKRVVKGSADDLRMVMRHVCKEEDGCWIWTGYIDPDGYGKVTRDQVPRRAHRYLYELLRGPVPLGLQLDHGCRVRCCVNPDHLEPVTHAENVRRGINANVLVTHCPQGHEYTPENTRYIKNASGGKSRICRACKRAYTNAARKKRWLEDLEWRDKQRARNKRNSQRQRDALKALDETPRVRGK